MIFISRATKLRAAAGVEALVSVGQSITKAKAGEKGFQVKGSKA